MSFSLSKLICSGVIQLFVFNHCVQCVFFFSVDTEDRKVKLKVEIKPVSPSCISTDNVSDIRNLVKGLHISATPTVCCRQLCHTFFSPANV